MDSALKLARLTIAAALLAFLQLLTLPRPAEACSCVEPQPLARYASQGSVILAGRVDGRDERGVRVAVERWFAGAGPAQPVWIAGDFGNSASCGVGSEPPVGSRWIWVAFRPDGERDLGISLCEPTADLATPEGQDLLDEALRTFGRGDPPAGIPVALPAPEARPLDPLPILATGAVMILGGVAIGGTVVVARRRGSAGR
jgi:hypothetical protein